MRRLQERGEKGAHKTEQTAEEATKVELDLNNEAHADSSEKFNEGDESDLEVQAVDEEEPDEGTTNGIETLAEEVECDVDLDEEADNEIHNNVNLDELETDKDYGLDFSNPHFDESSNLDRVFPELLGAALATPGAELGELSIARVDVGVQAFQAGNDGSLGDIGVSGTGDELSAGGDGSSDGHSVRRRGGGS